MLTVLDEYTREALYVVAKPRMGHAEVLDALYPLFLKSSRILSERYRYPRGRYGVKISTVAGIINFAAGF